MLKVKSFKPRFTSVITTANKYEEDVMNGSIIASSNETKGRIKWYQEVVAIGSSVRDLNVGDKVMINSANFAVRKFNKNSVQNDLDNNPVTSYSIPTVGIPNEKGELVEYLMIEDRDILYTFEGEETSDNIILPNKNIIIES